VSSDYETVLPVSCGWVTAYQYYLCSYTATRATTYTTTVTSFTDSSQNVVYSPASTVINPNSADPSKAEIPSQYNFTTFSVDKSPFFEIILYDSYGNRVLMTAGVINVDVLPVDPTKTSIASAVTDDHDGTYEVRLTPTSDQVTLVATEPCIKTYFPPRLESIPCTSRCMVNLLPARHMQSSLRLRTRATLSSWPWPSLSLSSPLWPLSVSSGGIAAGSVPHTSNSRRRPSRQIARVNSSPSWAASIDVVIHSMKFFVCQSMIRMSLRAGRFFFSQKKKLNRRDLGKKKKKI